uniref:RNA-dependent RNA polymerase n=1 Tax=Rhizophora mucronata TaxID=61149 RepID=A0A2P2JAG6_RHIMU
MTDSCAQRQNQPPLPPAVEEWIRRICIEQNQPPLGVDARKRLATLGEATAIGILRTISRTEIKYSFDGFVLYLASSVQGKHGSSPSRSPTLSASPSKSLCSSLLENRNPAPTVTPVLFDSRVDHNSQSVTPMQLETSDNNPGIVGKPAISPQLEALGELEFRKAFLILSYIGGAPLEKVISVGEIQTLKDLPMYKFEEEVWTSLGSRCGYIKANERTKSIHWDSGKTHTYHCHVTLNGSYKFKGPYLTPTKNVLQRVVGDDNILSVKFEEEKMDDRNLAGCSRDYFATYGRFAREGIFVGLRCYHFFVYKDGGKEEKKKNPTSSPVKCFFVRMESEAKIDCKDYVFSHKTVREARALFVHAESLSSLSKYMVRLSLLLSKTVNMQVNLSEVNIETIPDVQCKV